MAATISINFTTPEEVFSSSPPAKKSVSAKVLNEVLGGGVVGGGYVQRNGQTPMTSFLTLFSGTPTDDQPFAAVHKDYVDRHAFTRRYVYTVGPNVPVFSTEISGFDDYGARLIFFPPYDSTSINVIQRYVDVYRNGVLQVFNQDYELRNLELDESLQPILPPTVQFYSPLLSGTVVQINIGNLGATPSVVGVASLSANEGSGLRLGNFFNTVIPTGDLSISAYPLDFAASIEEMRAPSRSDLMVTPTSLSAFPLLPKAYGHFRREPEYERISINQKYGSPSGAFTLVRGYNMGGLFSGFESGDTPNTFTCRLCADLFNERLGVGDYSPKLEISLANEDSIDDIAVAAVYNNTKTLTGFKFTATTLFFEPPINIDEINITVY